MTERHCFKDYVYDKLDTPFAFAVEIYAPVAEKQMIRSMWERRFSEKLSPLENSKLLLQDLVVGNKPQRKEPYFNRSIGRALRKKSISRSSILVPSSPNLNCFRVSSQTGVCMRHNKSSSAI
eukprot:GHVS01086209.1.p1 GENE.GHVS01086209.1~~GHVS01086209.1.p1  ORF type:complete len:122 (+),score=6.56 GHVS01086209.1:1011-1376(+)